MTSNDSLKGERFAFSADIKKLLGLIINTFYSNKEVFLREIISNSSDAIDKIRFKSLTDANILGEETEFKIEIIPNAEEKTLMVRDNGIGMTKEELIKHLGTIANSGTKAFMDAITAGADIQMIGQFGVGFYASFLVSDKVEVRSKHNDDVQHVWASMAGGEFDIYDDSANPHALKRGTEVIMHLKDEHSEFLEERKLKEIVNKHSEFVAYPINLWVTKEVEKEVSDDEEVAAELKDEENEDKAEQKEGENNEQNESEGQMKIEEVSDDKDADKPKKKKVSVNESKWEKVNKTKSIWAMKPEDVKPEEYNSLYKSISNDWEDPLAYKHFKVEGSIEFTGVIFIPKRAPFDIFNNKKSANNIKLYVRRVFINDDAKKLCPEYLSFIKGAINSEEMPLNISRETLQQNKIMKIIEKNIVKKTIELIEELSDNKENFDIFYKNFSKNLKYGIHEDSVNRNKLAGFLRFQTTKSAGKDKSFKDYIADMKPNQTDIYYITGESLEAVVKLPYLERLEKNDLEVVYMVDPIDEYFVQQMTEFEGKKLVSVTKEGLELPLTDEEKARFEKQKEEFEPFCKRVKEILGNRVEKVEISNRMTNSPCYISTSKFGWSSRMEQIMKNQALRDNAFTSHMASKKILEINPDNAIIQEMSRRLKEDTNDPISKNLVFLIHDTAVLTSGGFTLKEPMEYADRIYKLTKLGLNIVEEPEEEMPQLEAVSSVGEGEAEGAAMEEVD